LLAAGLKQSLDSAALHYQRLIHFAKKKVLGDYLPGSAE
jgi:hypothetical protein